MSDAEFKSKYGPWALVTGASDGIGRAFAIELAERGLSVVLAARRQERLSELARELESRFGVRTLVVPTDLSDRQSARDLLRIADEHDVGLLVAAAGFGTSGPALSTDEDEEANLVEVNCAAALAQSLYFAKRMSARGRGGIVLLSSLVAFQGTPWSANYSASKAYIQTLAEGLGHELAEHGVDVLAVAPGPVDSGFAARANMNLGKAATPEEVARGAIKALGRARTVRPGFLSKFLGWTLSTAPRFVRVRIMGAIMGGMTKHQRTGAGAAKGA